MEEWIISKITVVDNPMGTGKTSWSIQYINDNQFENILYITPFLSEVERILDNTDMISHQHMLYLRNLMMKAEKI